MASILNSILLREQGVIKNNFYQEEIVKAQINRRPQKYRRIDKTFRKLKFEYIRSDSDGNLIGIYLSSDKFLHQTKVISRIYVMQFAYNPCCVQGTSNRNSLISSLNTKKMLRECLMITDTTDVHINGKKPMLFAANSNKEGMAGLTYFNCDGRNLDYEWRVQGQAFCCTSCNFSQQFALGCEEGYYLFNTVRMHEKKVLMNENVIDLKFNQDGNFLLLSSDLKGVGIFDVREHACHRRFCALKNEYGSSCRKRHSITTKSSYIRELKLLDDQTSVICADLNGYMEKVDIRMMKTVFQYDGHKGHGYRRCLCLNEDLDLICAPGSDHFLRMWSLSSGKLMYEKKLIYPAFTFVQEINEPPHCCFITNQRRWFLSTIQDNILIPIVPSEEFPDQDKKLFRINVGL